MKIAFTGNQHGMSPNQKEELRALLLSRKPTLVMHGNCIGSDAEFHDIVRELCPDVLIHIFPCGIAGKSAGKIGDIIELERHPLVRNHLMVDDSDMVVAAPKTTKEEVRSGTWATIRYAKKRRKQLIMLRPEVSEIEQLLG